MKKLLTILSICAAFAFIALFSIRSTNVYAKTKTYKVTFNANGGSVSTKSKKVTYGKTFGTLPTPKRSKCYFLGWYTAKSGGTKVATSTKVKIKKNITLYAHWKSNPVLKSLSSGKTYKYDITGDGKVDTLKYVSVYGEYHRIYVNNKKLMDFDGRSANAYYYSTDKQNEYIIINQLYLGGAADVYIYKYSNGKLVLCEAVDSTDRIFVNKASKNELILSCEFRHMFEGTVMYSHIVLNKGKATYKSTSTKVEDGSKYTAEEGFYLYSKASEKSSQKVYVKKGASIKVIGGVVSKGNAYIYVSVNGKKGYCNMSNADFLV